VERPACRPCAERGCGTRAKNGGGFEMEVVQSKGLASSENNKPAYGGGELHQRGSMLHSLVPQTSSSCMIGERDPQAGLLSPLGRLPMAICLAPNDILCRKRANGGQGMEGMGVAAVYQCSSIGPGATGGGDIDNGRSPHKRQRTACSEKSH
jgi:hypothetical protein